MLMESAWNRHWSASLEVYSAVVEVDPESQDRRQYDVRFRSGSPCVELRDYVVVNDRMWHCEVWVVGG